MTPAEGGDARHGRSSPAAGRPAPAPHPPDRHAVYRPDARRSVANRLGAVVPNGTRARRRRPPDAVHRPLLRHRRWLLVHRELLSSAWKPTTGGAAGRPVSVRVVHPRRRPVPRLARRVADRMGAMGGQGDSEFVRRPLPRPPAERADGVFPHVKATRIPHNSQLTDAAEVPEIEGVLSPIGGAGPFSATAGSVHQYTRRDSNPQPSVPKTDALSS